MLTQRRFLLAALTAVAALGSASTARALATEVIATPFTGADTSVHILLDDTGGNIAVTLTVNEGVADLRGFFLNISNFSLLDDPAFQVTGDDVTGWKLDERGVIDLKHGANLNGGGSPCPCDLGVILGTPGIGKDDIFTTTFVIDASGNLTLDDFAGQVIGVRVTSVGSISDGFRDDGSREDSAKLVATISDPIVPVPEPSTALLIALGLGTLAYVGRRPSLEDAAAVEDQRLARDERRRGAREVDRRAGHLVGRGDPVQRS